MKEPRSVLQLIKLEYIEGLAGVLKRCHAQHTHITSINLQVVLIHSQGWELLWYLIQKVLNTWYKSEFKGCGDGLVVQCLPCRCEEEFDLNRSSY